MQMNKILERLSISQEDMDKFVYSVRDEPREEYYQPEDYWYSTFVHMELNGYNNIYFADYFYYESKKYFNLVLGYDIANFTLEEGRLVWMYFKQMIRKEHGLEPYDDDSLEHWPEDPFLNVDMFAEYFDAYDLDYFLDEDKINTRARKIAEIILSKYHPAVTYNDKVILFNDHVRSNQNYNAYDAIYKVPIDDFIDTFLIAVVKDISGPLLYNYENLYPLLNFRIRLKENLTR